jgi:glycosyltransferase involved in cell wall biosynthesis
MTRNLLHVCNDLPYWSAHRRPIAEAARDAGWHVTVATAPHVSAEGLAASGFAHLPLPIERFRLNPVADARFFLTMRRLVAGARYDAIHLFTIKPLLIGGLAARFARVQDSAPMPHVIGTVAGLGRALDGKTSRGRAALTSFGLKAGLGRAAAAVTFENEGDRDFYVSSGAIDLPRTHVLPGAGVDLEIFKPDLAKRSPGVVTILYAGRLLRSKGVMDLVGAAKILKGQFGSTVRIVLAGPHTDGDPDGLDEAERRTLATSTDIEFLGARQPHEMPELMASADIFVLPTRYPEGLPRVLLEAGATGAALVAGHVDGTRAFIDHGINGLLLKRTNAESIADAMRRLIADAPLRNRLGAAARAKLDVGRYDIRKIVAQFLRLYDGPPRTAG